MEDYLPIIIQIIAGTVGAVIVNLAGGRSRLGPMAVGVSGFVGGVSSGQFAHVVAQSTLSRTSPFGPLIADLVGGFAGGVILTLFVGVVGRMAMRN